MDTSERTLKRFWAKVEINEETGCWEWVASKQLGGYGKFRVGGKHVLAHRFSWEMLRGPIPTGLQIDHLCRVRACVNPSHMEPVSPRANVLRGDTIVATNAAKTECLRGHPFDEENTYPIPSGGRSCRECQRQRAAEWYRRHRALQVAR